MLTVVLLPGMDGTGDLFEPFIAALGPEFSVTVVRYSTAEPLNYAELESLAHAALPAEGDFVILGESFSGPIAVSLAAAGSSRLKGLVLCCTFVRNPLPTLAVLKPFIGALPVGLAPVRTLSHIFLGRFSSANLRNALARAITKVATPTFHARLRAVLSVDVSQKLTEVSVPILYLRASQDRLVPQSASKLIQQICPHMKVVPIEGPHFLLQASPSEAAKAVVAWLREIENTTIPT